MWFAVQISLLTALFFATTLATPLKKQSRFTITQERINPFEKSPVKSLANTYRNKRDHRGVSASPEINSASPSNTYLEYGFIVSIDGQPVRLLFDTGSANLWVLGLGLQDKHQNHHLYDASASADPPSGALFWNTTFDFRGNNFGASGEFVTAAVEVGAFSSFQGVEVAILASQSIISDSASDGVLGLGFTSFQNIIADYQQPHFFDYVKQNLDEPLFTADFRINEPSSFDFGFIDPSKHTGDIVWVNNDATYGFWQTLVTGFTIGKEQSDHNGFKAAIASGCPNILLPIKQTTDYYSQVHNSSKDEISNLFVFPCKSVLPDLTLNLGSVYDAIIPGALLKGGPVNGLDIFGRGNEYCTGGIQINQFTSLGPDAILGSKFLQTTFVVFKDPDPSPKNSQLGFAAKSGEKSVLP
ncbi:Type I transmembrane sorting receptor [Schaereria dolodes]|nr:Type I transmembrane sorting receptor [Schaereria dolodes]